MASSTVAIIIIAVTIAFFIWNKFPMSVVSMAGARGDGNVSAGGGAIGSIRRLFCSWMDYGSRYVCRECGFV